MVLKSLFIVCTFIVSCTCVISMTGRESKCEVNRAALCQNLYNETRFPKTPHRSQEDAIQDINQYKALIDTRCAKHLRLFLCSFFIPMCTILDVKPCRSLCEEVKKGCEKILIKYVALPWPEQLNCDQFDDPGEKLCIEPPSVIKQNIVPENKRTKVYDTEKISLHCPKGKKITFKKILHEENRCKRHPSQDALRKLCNNEQTCEFQLQDITNKIGQPSTCTPGNVGPSSVKYVCTADHNGKQLVLHYGQDENLYCKSPSRRIAIMSVQFKDETCITPNAFCSVTQSCTGKQNCVLWANDHYIPSDCKGKNMKLTVMYECLKSTYPEKSIEIDLDRPGEELELSCRKGEMISILRAEYLDPLCKTREIHCAISIPCEKKNKCLLNKPNLAAVECNEGPSKVRIRYTCT